MPIQFNGVRVNASRSPDPNMVKNMILWGSIFDSLWMAPYVDGKGSAGNMGFRSAEGICVTASGSSLGSLNADDIMTVVDVKGSSVLFYGNADKRPSQETMIYWDIFNKRKDVHVVLHGHDLFSIENIDGIKKAFPGEIAVTSGTAEAGSPELRHQITQALKGSASYLLARGHGFFALGRTFDEAGKTALKIRQAVIELILGDAYLGSLRRKYEIV